MTRTVLVHYSHCSGRLALGIIVIILVIPPPLLKLAMDYETVRDLYLSLAREKEWEIELPISRLIWY